MAKISNKSAYPQQSPVALSDYLIGTDGATLATKTFTVQSLANIIDDTVTLQEVLNTGNSAYYNGASIPAQEGTMILGTTNGVGLSQDTITFNGQTGNITMVAGLGVVPSTANLTIDGDILLNTSSSDIIQSGGMLTSALGQDVKLQSFAGEDITLTTTDSGDIVFSGTGTAADFIATMGGDLTFTITSDVAITSQTQTLTSAGQAVFSSSGGDTIIGADDTLYIGQTTGIYEPTSIVIHGSQSITMSTDTATTNFRLNGSIPQIESNSPHYFDSEIRLDGGSAGTTGQVMISQGVGNNPLWVDDSTLAPHQVTKLVRNQTGATILKGSPVKLDSNPSGTPLVVLADATDASNLMPASGLATEDIENNQNGEITIVGLLQGVSATFSGTAPSIGDVVYVSSTAGQLTVDRPASEAELVQNVGIISRTAGQIDIQVTCTGRSNDLPNLDAQHIFIGSSVAPNINKPVSSSLIAINDSGPTPPNFDITIGNPTPTSTLIQGKFYGNVIHPYGESNLSFGEEALIDPSLTGVNNTAIGIDALRNTTLGESNTALGINALRNTTIGSNNIAIGVSALTTSTQGADNIAIGVNASGNTLDSIRNIAIGTEALRNVTGNTNNQNIAIGWRSADALTAGEKNVVIGAQALGVQSTASSFSTIIGESAGGNANIVAGMNQSVLIGFEAGWGATDDRVVAIGYQAGRVNAGAANVFIGKSAGVINTGNGNTLIGTEIGLVSAASSQNTLIGSGTATALTTGNANTFLGERNGNTAATSDSVVLIGRDADVNAAADSTAVAVGTSSRVTTEATALGHAAQANGTGSIALGNGAVSTQPAGFNIRNLPQGGLTAYADRAAAIAAGLLPGDVYVLTPGGPDNPGTSFVLAII
jgi:hypothetical protein